MQVPSYFLKGFRQGDIIHLCRESYYSDWANLPSGVVMYQVESVTGKSVSARAYHSRADRRGVEMCASVCITYDDLIQSIRHASL